MAIAYKNILLSITIIYCTIVPGASAGAVYMSVTDPLLFQHDARGIQMLTPGTIRYSISSPNVFVSYFLQARCCTYDM